jgi:hypothetical protein
MARYYFERTTAPTGKWHEIPHSMYVWAIRDSHEGGNRVGTLHDVVLAERVVDLLNGYEERFDGR